LTNKTQTRQHSIARWAAVAGSLVLSGLIASVAFGQEGSSSQAMHHGQMSQQATTQQMSAPCTGMMETNQNMMSDLEHMSSKLDDLVAKMDEAKGDAKVAAMSDVLHELVDQRTCMVGMLSHMPMGTAQGMGHMQGAQGQGMYGSMGMGSSGQTPSSGHMMGHSTGHMGTAPETSESSSQP
jgi:hypothetical protein